VATFGIHWLGLFYMIFIGFVFAIAGILLVLDKMVWSLKTGTINWANLFKSSRKEQPFSFWLIFGSCFLLMVILGSSLLSIVSNRSTQQDAAADLATGDSGGK